MASPKLGNSDIHVVEHYEKDSDFSLSRNDTAGKYYWTESPYISHIPSPNTYVDSMQVEKFKQKCIKIWLLMERYVWRY